MVTRICKLFMIMILSNLATIINTVVLVIHVWKRRNIKIFLVNIKINIINFIRMWPHVPVCMYVRVCHVCHVHMNVCARTCTCI